MTNQKLAYGYLNSPLGDILIAGADEVLHRIDFPVGGVKKQPEDAWISDTTHLNESFKQLRSYFAGELKQFDLKLHFEGSPFQKSVWIALCDIEYGKTISYGTLAKWIDNPKASQAVGAANGANNIPIVVPCHRVIGADNSLVGFTGGLDIKRFLLEHEKAYGYQYSLLD